MGNPSRFHHKGVPHLDGLVAHKPTLFVLIPQNDERSAVVIESDGTRKCGHFR